MLFLKTQCSFRYAKLKIVLGLHLAHYILSLLVSPITLVHPQSMKHESLQISVVSSVLLTAIVLSL